MSWVDEFKATSEHPVKLWVCERWSPDHPTHEGGWSCVVRSRQEMMNILLDCKDSYYEVGLPHYDHYWNRKLKDMGQDEGMDHWSLDVYECAPDEE